MAAPADGQQVQNATLPAAAAAGPLGAEVDGVWLKYYTGTFKAHPYLLPNFQQMLYLKSGDLLLHLIRNEGTGVLISKERADRVLGSEFVKRAKALLRDLEIAVNEGEQHGTRPVFSDEQQSKRRKVADLLPAARRQSAVERGLKDQEKRKALQKSAGYHPCYAKDQRGVCYCEDWFARAPDLAKHEGKGEHRFVRNALSTEDEFKQIMAGRTSTQLQTDVTRATVAVPSIEELERERAAQRDTGVRGFHSLTTSDDGTQDKYHLLVHRLAARYNLKHTKVSELLDAHSVFSKSDGASAYNCLFSRMVLRIIHEIDGGPRVVESCISVAGDGKTGLDRFFAEVGRKIRMYLRSGHDTTNAEENCAALGYEGQLKGSITSTVVVDRSHEADLLGMCAAEL